jgi:hypothetical protein
MSGAGNKENFLGLKVREPIACEAGSRAAPKYLVGEKYGLLRLYPYWGYVEEGGPMAQRPDFGELASTTCR